MSEPNRPKERRLHRRYAVKGSIDLGRSEGRAMLRDISASGLSCLSPVAFEEMAVLEISMRLPHPDGAVEFKVGGAVVRCEPAADGLHDVAVFFTQLDEANRKVLADFIARQG